MSLRKENKEKQDHLMSMLGEVREELGKIPGVFTVGVGLKEIKDRHTEEIVYRVYVYEKKSSEQLQPHEMVPKQIRGVNTDVLIVPQAQLRTDIIIRGDDLKYRPLHAGTMIGKEGAPGTLGCFARLNKDGSTVILSNDHVIAEDKQPGDFMGQPNFYEFCCKCCGCYCNEVGTLVKGIRNETVDVAIAKVLPNIGVETEKGIYNKLNTQALKITGIEFAQVNDVVFKVGAISGYTKGIVKEIAGPVKDAHPDRINQMYIVPAPDETFHEEQMNLPAFSTGGDSGAVVLNGNGKIVGLLWGGSPFFKKQPTDPDPVVDTTFAMNIHDALVALEQSGFGITIENTPAANAAASAMKTFEDVQEKSSREKLLESELGAFWLSLFNTHAREINYMVNNDRQVTVTWQRNQGPAFTAHIIKSSQDKDYKIPLVVENIPLNDLLVKMAAILKARASLRLKNDLEKHALEIIDFISGIQSADEFLERLEEKSMVF